MVLFTEKYNILISIYFKGFYEPCHLVESPYLSWFTFGLNRNTCVLNGSVIKKLYNLL